MLARYYGRASTGPTPAAAMVRFINDFVGASHDAARFGALAYAHPCMGPLALALTIDGPAGGGGPVAGIDIRVVDRRRLFL